MFFGEKGADSRGCRIEAIRVSDGEMVYGTDVTISMAKAEGWMSNSKWKNMPEQMLAYRAAAFFARVYCPDALMGIQVEGEAEDLSLREKRVIGDVLTDNEPTDPKPSTKAASDPLAGRLSYCEPDSGELLFSGSAAGVHECIPVQGV